MKLEFSWQIFEKYLNIKFHENPSSGSLVVPCRRRDGRTWSQQSLFAIWGKFLKTVNSATSNKYLIKIIRENLNSISTAVIWMFLGFWRYVPSRCVCVSGEKRLLPSFCLPTSPAIRLPSHINSAAIEHTYYGRCYCKNTKHISRAK